MRLHVVASTLLLGTSNPKKVGRLGRLVSKLLSHAFAFNSRHGMAMEQEASANVHSLDRFIIGPAACGAAGLESVRARSMCMSRWTCRKTSWGHGRSMAGSCVTGKS
jgi:hypothetical protein